MGWIDRLVDISRSLLTLQDQIQQLRTESLELRNDLRELRSSVHTLAERVVRLEAQREAENAERQAMLKRFEAELSQVLNATPTRRSPRRRRSSKRK